RIGKKEKNVTSFRASAEPKTNLIDTRGEAHAGQLVPVASSPRVSSTPEKKAYVYREVVKNLNTSRERGFPFRPAMCFKDACVTLGAEVTRGKSVNMKKIWQLLQVSEYLTCLDNVPDTDGSIRAMRSKIAGFLASNTHRNWPRDLYEKVARCL
ncbi:hypothetical protein CARUB_v10025268mg, partial [Capsella rubella]